MQPLGRMRASKDEAQACGTATGRPPSRLARHSASTRVFTGVFDGLWTRVNALYEWRARTSG